MAVKNISRREMLKAMGYTAAATGLAACAQPAAAPAPAANAPAAAAEPTKAAAAAPQQKSFKILHWAQGSEPTDPKTPLTEGQVAHVGYQKIADAYTKEHPNVTIEWYRFPTGSQWAEWYMARMTAEDAPDIFWANTEDLWPHVNKGWSLDFTEYMNQPNPYVAGNKAWKDQFEEISIISQTGPDGKLYGVNMDGAGVMIVYNKDAFKKAAIDKEPETWGDFMAAFKKLKDAGFIPFGADTVTADCCFPHWFQAHTYCQLLWDDVYKWDDDKNKVITAKELVTHAQKGDALDWDAYLQMAHMLKTWVPYFPVGFEGQLDYRALFRQGKVAMYLEGNWQTSAFKASPPPFEFGWLHFPIVTKDVWAKAPEKIVRIQGAWGSMQYHVPGYLAKKDPEKVQAIMDWLMFSSKPENVTMVVQETGMVPLTKGAKGIPELEPFTRPYDRAVPYQSWQTLSTSAYEAEYKLWQAYLPSDMSDAEYLKMVKASWDAEVKKMLEANPTWKM
jgi:raffinose/stachyose/melibiose transport system substrate-binding protein